MVTNLEDLAMAVISVTFRTPAATAAKALGPHAGSGQGWAPRVPFSSAGSSQGRPAQARGLWARIQEALDVRRTRRLLAAMDDRMLSDIGVSRTDAGQEAQRVLWDSDLLR
jgi:uncharacterized protein YjiS (DUF1127 family)